MANKLYAWDEIENTIAERDPEDIFRCSAEGGWIHVGWYNANDPTNPDIGHSDPIVAVLHTDRHLALETWAESIEEAHRRFLINDIFRQYTDE